MGHGLITVWLSPLPGLREGANLWYDFHMTKKEATAAAATVALPANSTSDRKAFKSGGHWYVSVNLPDLPNGMKNKTALRLG